jgi:hypothetical protein
MSDAAPMTTSNNNIISAKTDDDNRPLNDKLIVKFETVTDITRYALLISIAIGSTFFTLVLMTLIASFYNYDDSEEIGSIAYMIVSIDCVINTLCLYLLKKEQER